jgi:hypothetical protein
VLHLGLESLLCGYLYQCPLKNWRIHALCPFIAVRSSRCVLFRIAEVWLTSNIFAESLVDPAVLQFEDDLGIFSGTCHDCGLAEPQLTHISGTATCSLAQQPSRRRSLSFSEGNMGSQQHPPAFEVPYEGESSDMAGSVGILGIT